MRPGHLSILGVGLLGGSLGLAVRSALSDCKITGYGHRRETIDRAERIGAIDQGYDDPVWAVRGADLVVLCTPVRLLGPLLERILPALAEEAVVTDVGSTKRSLVAHAERILSSTGKGPRFVGSHPMAGSEKRGVEFARSDLFRGATCITTPTPRTDSDALERIESFWKLIGMKIIRLSPEDHDRHVAGISHLPHAVAAALVAMQSDASLDLAGKGFLDATRIAGGDGGLWRDIFLDNQDNLRGSLAMLRSQLDAMLGWIDAGEGDALRDWLDQAAQRRQRLLQEKLKELDR